MKHQLKKFKSILRQNQISKKLVKGLQIYFAVVFLYIPVEEVAKQFKVKVIDVHQIVALCTKKLNSSTAFYKVMHKVVKEYKSQTALNLVA